MIAASLDDATELALTGTSTATVAGDGRKRTGDEEGPAFFGRYIVLSRLGAGGMGVVHAAYDPQLDRKVAIKLVRNPRAGDDSRTMRLQREAQAMAKLSHPNVITVHDVGVVDGRVFIAMEFVAGVTLADWLKGAHDWGEVLDIFLRAGAGLSAAHQAGLVHRD
ncbi:MAG: serine/threonine protein kinase, partial [Myxococcales bacterium]|nr:serine/threonine protein kinase [Myxococcales bacterium]